MFLRVVYIYIFVNNIVYKLHFKCSIPRCLTLGSMDKLNIVTKNVDVFEIMQSIVGGCWCSDFAVQGAVTRTVHPEVTQ